MIEWIRIAGFLMAVFVLGPMIWIRLMDLIDLLLAEAPAAKLKSILFWSAMAAIIWELTK